MSSRVGSKPNFPASENDTAGNSSNASAESGLKKKSPTKEISTNSTTPLSVPNHSPSPDIHTRSFSKAETQATRENGANSSDYYFMNGNTIEGFEEQIADVLEHARKVGRENEFRFSVNGFAIVEETEAEAIQLLQGIQGKADKEAVEAFGDADKQAGSSTGNKKGMWADSKFEDLVQYNDGSKTKLIGTKEQVADRILFLKSLGIDIVLLAFLHYEEDIENFRAQVLPLVRQLGREGRGKNAEDEIERTGDVYRAKKVEKS